MPASLETKSPKVGLPSAVNSAPDPFFYRKLVRPNGHTEEITLGAPFARVLIAVLVLVGVIVLIKTNVNIGVITAIMGAVRAAKQWL